MVSQLTAAALSLALGVASAALIPSTVDASDKPEAYGHDDVFTFFDQVAYAASLAEAADPAASPWEYERISRCGWSLPSGTALIDCLGEPVQCLDAATPLPPYFRRPKGSTDEAAWERISDWTCPEQAVPTLTAQDLRDLPIVSGSVELEPAAGPLLVNMANVVHTDAAIQRFTPTLLGFAYEVEVTATSYTWDFADGTYPLVTTDPGSAYNNSSGEDLRGYLTHIYAQPGTHQITLTTTWTGRYRVVGRTEWQDVIGTATTTATGRTFDVVERRANLVATDCVADPTAPGCD